MLPARFAPLMTILGCVYRRWIRAGYETRIDTRSPFSVAAKDRVLTVGGNLRAQTRTPPFPFDSVSGTERTPYRWRGLIYSTRIFPCLAPPSECRTGMLQGSHYCRWHLPAFPITNAPKFDVNEFSVRPCINVAPAPHPRIQFIRRHGGTRKVALDRSPAETCRQGSQRTSPLEELDREIYQCIFDVAAFAQGNGLVALVTKPRTNCSHARKPCVELEPAMKRGCQRVNDLRN